MKKKHVVIVALVLVFAAIMCACGNVGSTSYDKDYSIGDESSTAGRVVVYTYYADVYVDGIDEANTDITAIVASFSENYGCYIKLSEKTDTYAYYTIKIKSAGFSSAVSRLAEVGEVEYEKTISVDITDYSSGGTNELSTLNVHVYLEGSNDLSLNERLWKIANFVWSNIIGNVFAIAVTLLPFGALAFGIVMIVHNTKRKKRKKAETEKAAANAKSNDDGNYNAT